MPVEVDRPLRDDDRKNVVFIDFLPAMKCQNK